MIRFLLALAIGQWQIVRILQSSHRPTVVARNWCFGVQNVGMDNPGQGLTSLGETGT